MLVAGDVIEYVGVDVPVTFGDSTSNRSRDIRAAHFVMDDDDELKTANAGYGIRQHEAHQLVWPGKTPCHKNSTQSHQRRHFRLFFKLR